VLVLADEVYEKCVYDNADFPRIGTIEELWPRSITIMSSGKVLIFNKWRSSKFKIKTFNTTGWRVGYAIGDEPLINGLVGAQRSTIFCVNRPCSVICF